MEKLAFKLVEQLTDLRSSEKTYTLRVENSGTESIQIHSITPRIPETVELIEIRDTVLAGSKARYQEICEELSTIVSEATLRQSEKSRESLVGITRKIIKDAFSKSWLLFVNRVQFQRIIERRLKESAAWLFLVENIDDAKSAQDRFLKSGGEDEASLNLYEGKLEQLERYESKLGSEASTKELTVVAPDSFFAMGYTLKFPRSSISPRKYVISIDVTYSTQSSQELLGAATESIVISPNPFVLSVIAVFSGLLGLIVRATFPAGGDISQLDSPTAVSLWTDFGQVFDIILSMQGASACILALVLFNIYEYTEIGKKIAFGVGWRSALTVGVLSGLFSERVIQALSVIVGTSS